MTSEMASDIFKNVLSSSPSKQGKNIAALADEDVHTVRYWLYAPGEGSCIAISAICYRTRLMTKYCLELLSMS